MGIADSGQQLRMEQQSRSTHKHACDSMDDEKARAWG